MYIAKLINDAYLAGMMSPIVAPGGKALTIYKPGNEGRMSTFSRWLVYDESIDAYVEMENEEVENSEVRRMHSSVNRDLAIGTFINKKPLLGVTIDSAGRVLD